MRWIMGSPNKRVTNVSVTEDPTDDTALSGTYSSSHDQ